MVDRVVLGKTLSSLGNTPFDLVYVNGGELIGPDLVKGLKDRYGRVVNYNNDDPYGLNQHRRWRLYLRSLALYDLSVVVRPANVEENYRAGARNVLRVHMSADEIAHAPRLLTVEDKQKWASDVTFIGTWMPERGPFLAQLLAFGIPLSIWGDGWHKAPEWTLLRRSWRGPGLSNADDYAKAVQCSRICLGLLSKGNRDLHTTRSMEIPYLGAFLCAERTEEHLALYEENKEAVFWSDAEECAERCHRFLGNEQERVAVTARGRLRCIQNGKLNEPTLEHILQTALQFP